MAIVNKKITSSIVCCCLTPRTVLLIHPFLAFVAGKIALYIFLNLCAGEIPVYARGIFHCCVFELSETVPGTNVTKMTSPTSPSARIGNPCLVHCEKMRFTVPKFKNTPLLPLDPLDQFTESWSDWEFPTHFMGPMKAWYVLLCDNFTGATIWWARKPAAPSVVFFCNWWVSHSLFLGGLDWLPCENVTRQRRIGSTCWWSNMFTSCHVT